jgi:hypothetical protein
MLTWHNKVFLNPLLGGLLEEETFLHLDFFSLLLETYFRKEISWVVFEMLLGAWVVGLTRAAFMWVLEPVHGDLSGPIMPTTSGEKMFLLLPSKPDMPEAIKRVRAEVEVIAV